MKTAQNNLACKLVYSSYAEKRNSVWCSAIISKVSHFFFGRVNGLPNPNKIINFFDRSILFRVLGLAIYLIFVWSMAYIKKDYIWFPGDAANLLQQSILMSKGFLPNVDFFSGYPGLDIQINATILSLMESSLASQHVYMALSASALGLFFFLSFDRVEPWLITLSLLFIYSQGLYPNPAPNPGYLFIVFFVIGLKKTIDYFYGYSFFDSILAGFFFSLAFLSKQYGIFGPVCFFIATMGFLNCHPKFQKKIFLLVLATVSSLFIVFYAHALWGNVSKHREILLNTLVFSIPFFSASIIYFKSPGQYAMSTLSFRRALQANILLVVTFLATTVFYLIYLYGFDALPEVLNKFLIQAPRRINQNIYPVSFSVSSTAIIFLGLIFFTLPFVFNSDRVGKFNSIWHFCNFVILCLSLFFIFRFESLHMTVFVVFAYIAAIIMVSYNNHAKHRKVLLAVISGFSPCFVLLIPWPNPAYHIPILVFFVLIALQLFRENTKSSAISTRMNTTAYLTMSIFVYCLLTIYPHNTVNRNLVNWSFGNLNFTSGDKSWSNSINEANLVMQEAGICSSYGCRFLVFSTQWKRDYLEVIEKP